VYRPLAQVHVKDWGLTLVWGKSKRVSIRRRAQVLRAIACLVAVSTRKGLRSGAAFAQPQPPAPPAEPGATGKVRPATTPIEGFRQARFGMSEQQVRQAIQRDFPAVANRLSRTTHPREKTTALTLTVEEVLPDIGPAQISYILGYTSKRLVQVNIIWTSDGRTAARDDALISAANALRDHFLTRYHPPDAIVANHQVGDNAILVFRAEQANGRMVLLLLTGTAAAGRVNRNPAPLPLALQLSYMRDHAHPDVFRIERGRF
jgi:hypothetical protein